MELVENIYHLTDSLPDSEKFHITSQIHRCATSVPANIAEGHGRGSSKDFQRYLFISRGSAYELETFLLLIERLYKRDLQKEKDILDEIQKMLSGLIKSLND